MAFVFMHVDLSLFTLLNLHDNEVFGLLTIVIIDDVLVSIIDKGGTPRTESLREDVSTVHLSALGVKLLGLPKLLVDDQFGLAQHIKLSSRHNFLKFTNILDNSHRHIRIELSELLQACLSSGHFADMLVFTVKVCSKIINSHDLSVEKSDALGSSKNQVLGNLYSHTPKSDDSHSHLNELAHRLHSEGSNLPRVQVGVNFRFAFHDYFG